MQIRQTVMQSNINFRAVTILFCLLVGLLRVTAAIADTPNCSLFNGMQQQLCRLYLTSDALHTNNNNEIWVANKVTVSQNGNQATWLILDPPFNVPTSSYPQIVIQGGDQVQVTAGGCGQNGGHGSTWYGLLENIGPTTHAWVYSIPNVVGINNRWSTQQDPSGQGILFDSLFDNSTQTVGGSGPQGVFSLGFWDDGYPDNGYYSHDNGPNGECQGWYGGWVQVQIVHNASASGNNGAGLSGQQVITQPQGGLVQHPLPLGGGSSQPIAIEDVHVGSMVNSPQSCPATVQFAGYIAFHTHQGPIAYRWVRSDGATGPVMQIAPGILSPVRVTESWTLWQTYSGWERLEIVPSLLTSGLQFAGNQLPAVKILKDQADFTLHCR